jgi:hypothetical protein
VWEWIAVPAAAVTRRRGTRRLYPSEPRPRTSAAVRRVVPAAERAAIDAAANDLHGRLRRSRRRGGPAARRAVARTGIRGRAPQSNKRQPAVPVSELRRRANSGGSHAPMLSALIWWRNAPSLRRP